MTASEQVRSSHTRNNHPTARAHIYQGEVHNSDAMQRSNDETASEWTPGAADEAPKECVGGCGFFGRVRTTSEQTSGTANNHARFPCTRILTV